MSLSFISVFTPAITFILRFIVLDERPTGWTVVVGVLIVADVVLAITRPMQAADESSGARKG